MIADQNQRDAALDPARSFIVQAPAGSGKTDLLVKRFIRLLSIVQKPEEILAITFTKKAAAEMRKRVLEGIADAGEIAHRLRIQTIDSLCTALTRQMPVLARFGGQPEIVEDASPLYAEAARRVLRNFNEFSERLLKHLDNDVDRAAALLAQMLRDRDRWIRKTGVAPTRKELEAALVFERNRLLSKARSLYPGASEELARELLTQDYAWRKKHPLAQSLSGNEPLREALEMLCRMPPPAYSDSQWEALEAILALLNPAVAHLKVVFAENGQADFTEFAHGALAALGSVDDPSDLLLSLDQKISHILVDEFQDTSQSQFALLERLTAGWTGGDEVGGSGRSLFVVGDPMQSIYRFREAEVGLFLRTKNAGLGSLKLEPLTLTTNFRSQENLVRWFNDVFPRVLPPVEDETSGAVPYSGATPNHPALPGPAVTWHCFYDREAEARQVISILGSSQGRKAILVRNRAHLDHVVPALKDAGIEWKAIQIEQLNEVQVVQDLYALTRALLHPGDRVAWLACLRAPWCGLSLQDLHLLANPSGENSDRESLVCDLLKDTSRLSPDGRARVARVREVLEAARRDRARGGLRDRVEGAWLALGGPACARSRTDLEDADAFLDELERLEDAGRVDLAALEEKTGKLWALPDVEAKEDAVEIMTIHRAKGLEFDTVIVPGLDRLPRAGPKPLFAWKAAPGGRLLLAPIDETGEGEDPTYKYVRELDRQADDIESGRLFYVAATRAKKQLHLFACARADEEGAARPPTKRTLLSKIWWQAQPHFGPAPAEAMEEEKREPIPDVLYRLPADFKVPGAPAAASWTAPEEAPQEAEVEFSWAGETARHVGTVVHRWLQRIAEDALEGWDDARIDGLRNRFRDELHRRGVPANELKASGDLVAAALKGSISDERGRWILGPHPESRSEYRVRAGGRNFVMDRVFRGADGAQWIVDYKTSRHEGADPAAFLDRELGRYAPQLAAYAQLVGGSRQGLYFPLLRGWRERKPG